MSEGTDIVAFLEGQIEMLSFDESYARKAKDHQKNLTKPLNSLGKLEEVETLAQGRVWSGEQALKNGFEIKSDIAASI